MRRLLYWLTSKLPARYINHNSNPYLERYYLADILGIRFYIHRFVDSDPEGVHDHPFLYSFSVLLAGWYNEDRWAKKYKRTWFNYIGPNDFHRVVLPDNGSDVWTLFMHSARVKPWGFLQPKLQEDSMGDIHKQHYDYTPQSESSDPAISDWHKNAPTGNYLRENMRSIPLGTRVTRESLVKN